MMTLTKLQEQLKHIKKSELNVPFIPQSLGGRLEEYNPMLKKSKHVWSEVGASTQDLTLIPKCPGELKMTQKAKEENRIKKKKKGYPPMRQ